ncbi:hypothetical protein ACIBQ0_37410 [Nocardia nova]|uniref:hypothetical protein n=1 Tax=Nocardia nova TaxID=37330 RepID=UPI00379CB5E1
MGSDLRYHFRAVADAMTAPDHEPLAVFHARQALLAISWSIGMMGDVDLTDEQCRRAAEDIALAIYERAQ